MRFACSFVLLLLLFTACNRDATDPATADSGEFLAPSPAPLSPSQPGDNLSSKAIKEGSVKVLGPGDRDPEASVSQADQQLTPEQLAAAKRMGPGRTFPRVTDPEATPSKKPTTKAMPNPATEGKPVLEYDRPLFSLYKPPCRGNCPNFTLTLTADRQLLLEAKNNLEKQGNFAIRLTAREHAELLADLEALGLNSLEEVYPQDTRTIPADQQATFLTFPNDEGKEKRLEVYFDAPEKLAAFMTKFEGFLDRKDWVKIAQ